MASCRSMISACRLRRTSPHRLGSRGLTPRTAELACDKGLMREQWARDGLPNPDFRVVLTEPEARAACSQIGLPAGAKPADSGGGGRGVSVVRDESRARPGRTGSPSSPRVTGASWWSGSSRASS